MVKSARSAELIYNLRRSTAVNVRRSNYENFFV
nr:MAG TPA: hypothetical protein [Caudoviricetes sp.]